MKHLFIINPAAGKGDSLEYVPLIEKLCEEAGLYYGIEITKAPGHATEISKQSAADELCRVYSVGGDGTINEVVNGIAGTKSSLAVIPAGSGNDFFRSINSHAFKRSHKLAGKVEILKRTLAGIEREIDLACINGQYFINISSIGFDAQVVSSTLKFKGKPGISGSTAYMLGIIASLASCRNYNLALTIDGKTIRRTTLFTAVANGRYYGGGMKPVPNAQLDDGKLDLCLAGKQTRMSILRLFPKYVKGLHGNIKGVEFFTCSKVTIASSLNLPLNIDGEILFTKKAEYEILPRGIKVVFPQTNSL